MKIIILLLMSVAFVGCSSAGKKAAEVAEDATSEASDSAKSTMDDISGSVDSAVDSATSSGDSSGASCDMKPNKSTVNFGSRKVTSRAFKRLRLKASSPFTVTSVTSFERPFGYYNSGDFPGEATYHSYSLCDMSTPSKDCSVNLEFRPRAVNEYSSSMTISYTDSSGGNCSVEVPLTGVSTESYLGKDSSLGLPDN